MKLGTGKWNQTDNNMIQFCNCRLGLEHVNPEVTRNEGQMMMTQDEYDEMETLVQTLPNDIFPSDVKDKCKKSVKIFDSGETKEGYAINVMRPNKYEECMVGFTETQRTIMRTAWFIKDLLSA